MIKAQFEGDKNMAEFGKYLKAVREKRGLGLNQLAALSGVSSSLISRVENGKRGAPKSSTIDELAKILKVPQIEMIFMAGYPSILQSNPDHKFSDLAYKYMNEEDLEAIKKYQKATHQYRKDARELLKEEPQNIVGERLVRLRDKKGITHEELAESLGFAPFVIFNIEEGAYRPDPEMVSLIADYFQVSADYLLGREDKQTLLPTIDSDFENWLNDPRASKFYKEFNESSEERREMLLAMWEVIKNQKKE